MAKISTYPVISLPTLNDLLIGTDVENFNETKNFSIGDITNLIILDNYVPYINAVKDVDLGLFGITASSFISPGGTSSQFLKADGTLDSTTYQIAGDYLTGLSGEATATGPGIANVVLDNSSVISKVLTGLTISGGTISDTDTILTAFGKVQNQINGIVSGLDYQGLWNASTNNPFLSSGIGVSGYYYVVGVAGNTDLNGITDWNVGDWVIFNGSTWQKIDNTDTVVSVNGKVGIVVLTTTDISEGTNLYYTDDRARTAISLTTTGDSGVSTYSNITGILNIPNYSISGLGGVPSSRQLTINGTQYDLSADRSWSVGTITSISTSGPITGGTITGSGIIGITQSSGSSDGYLSYTDWNTFNNKQNALTNPVTGTGTVYYLPMWSGLTTLTDSIISYSSNIVDYNYNSSSGATINYKNTNGVAYTYTIQMNNTGTRQTYHSYTDGNIIQRINSNDVSKNLSTGQLVLPYYTTTSSFTGVNVGYLGFDNLGNIITVAPPSLTGYVPYTGATGNVDLGEYELKAGQLTLDISPTGTASVATTRWNNTMGISETTLKGGNVILKNGVDLVARVVNKVTPNATLTKAAYQAVRISGAQGQRLAVALAQANVDANSADTIGLVTETIPTNQEGFIMVVGNLEGINTTGSLQGETWADGDVIYLSPSTPGALTNIKPNGSTGHIVVMGYVEYSHAINGKIYVKVMNGWELDELHNVFISSPLNNQGLFYTSSTQLWENKSIATALGYTPISGSGTINYVSKFTSSTSLGDSLIYDNGTNVMINTTSLHSSYPNARLIVNNASNTYLEIRSASSQSSLILSKGNSDTSTTPSVELFNSSNFGIVMYRPGVVSSNYLMYYDSDSLSNRYLAFQTEGFYRLTLNQTGTVRLNAYTTDGFVKFSGSNGTLAVDTTSYTPTTRTLTINGTAYDLSANRTWSVGTVTGTGTTNYLPKWTSSTALGDSLVYDNGTNVGIGTTSPSTKFYVSGYEVSNWITTLNNTGTSGHQMYFGYNDGSTTRYGLYIAGGPGSGVSNFDLAVANKFYVTSGGNVGIGVSGPGYKLQVSAASATDSDIFLAGMTGVSNGFTIKRVSSSFIYSMIDGNVGIGTTSPGTKLEVFSTAPLADRTLPHNVLTITAEQNNAPYSFFGGAILFKNRSYVSGMVESSRIRSVIYDDGTPNNFGGGLWFETTPTPGGTLTPSLTIKYNGNVGIGTTTPGSRLSVVGLPTSSSGLSSGDIWNDGGTLKIV